MSCSKLFALGWLWHPAATAVLCPPSKGSWWVFVCPVTGHSWGDELCWWVCSCRQLCSAAWRAESSLWSSDHPHWEVSKQPARQRWMLTWELWGQRCSPENGASPVRHQSPRQPLLSQQVIPHGGLGMSHSRQTSRGCLFPSGLRENLECVPIPLDRCVGGGQGMCEMLGVSGGFWLKLWLLQVVKW